eukprot:XP_011610617.1 PREDICTED: complement C3-like isoform X1 [Takifugu rubripes]
MRSGLDVCRPLVWLFAFCSSSTLIGLAGGSSLKVMSAPNILQVGTPVNVFVECQDCTGEDDIQVEILVLSYPTKSRRLASRFVTLRQVDHFQSFGVIRISPTDFSLEPNLKQYVFLQARFPDIQLEKAALVSFQSGYIYIQTDKTLYTPNSKLHYRMFAVTPHMEPVERDNQTDTSITVQIVSPEGIILESNTVFLQSGMYSGSYKLAEIVSIGLWRVEARFSSKPQMSYSSEFEVKEHVLPSFEVKLILESPFFYTDSQELTVEIKATYLFGEEVDGTAYGVFGVIHRGRKHSIPSSLQRVEITGGEGQVQLKKEHLSHYFQNIQDLVGSSMFVAVGVLTESGSEMVGAEFRGIKIVTSPYTLSFKRTPKYFKPGMSFDVMVEVANSDGSPAQGVNVVVDPGEVKGRTSANGLARLSINTDQGSQIITVTARTDVRAISPERQASTNMTATSYTTTSNSYLHIGVDRAQVSVGENLKVIFSFIMQDNTDKDITYLILSRGQLVKHGFYRTQGQTLISMTVPVTSNMMPSFRLIAYYHPSDNEVVSDSVWVDVQDSCLGSLKLETTTPSSSYEPRKMFGLKVTGDPGATVGLVAVDKGVFVLNNKHLLNQQKVWDTVESYDTGCTPGGGKNGISVFSDAGLLFVSNTASATPHRQEYSCPAPSRKKRDTTLRAMTTSLANQYEDQLQRDCCLDGIRDSPLSYSCERRSEYIGDEVACVEAFLRCCKEMETKKEDDLQVALSKRGEEDDSYMDSDEIVSRTQFPASWLWMDVKLPPCPETQPTCPSTSMQKHIPLQDSITTWQFIGISLSRSLGICIAEPLEVIVRKDFFLDVKLPYFAVRGEQLQIKVLIYNYSPNPATVVVDLFEQQDLCSAAFKRGKHRQAVHVGRKTSLSVPFIVIPVKEGQYPIEVKAAVKDSMLSDGIKKTLRVVPDGIMVKVPKTVVINPEKIGEDGKQVEIINSRISPRDFVPNTPTSTQIYVTGRDQADKLENDINGESVGNLIYQPGGDGEENMIHLSLTVAATWYLDQTNQWEAVNIDRRNEALQHIRTGHLNQLTYRKTDGSFAAYPDQQSSTWLTAFVVKVLAMADKLVAVKRTGVCDAVEFLISRVQTRTGLFHEAGEVFHSAMMGDVLGTDSDASMTAFCLIAMQESQSICTHVTGLQASKAKAMVYLEMRLPTLINPYAVAIASYALANENKLRQDILFKFASPDSSYWQVPMGRVYTLEATAYSLLALVKSMAFEEATPVVRWLNKQQRVAGGFGSTQATILVYQALAEFWTSYKGPEYDLNVDILLPGRSKPDMYNFDRESRYTTRTSKMKSINQNVKVTATGKGEAVLKMVSLYYALPKDKDCPRFDLSVQLLPEKKDEDEATFQLTIKVLHKDLERDANMSVLDIGLLTGFDVNTQDLSLLSKGRARTISKYSVNPPESDRGALIIYLDKISHKRPEEIKFRIHQKFKVGVMQPAAVSVYEHALDDSNQTSCVRFYHPERTSGQLLRLCRGDECTCAEENCSMQKKGNISNDERTAKACETQQFNKIDYVYKVRLQDFTKSLSTDVYTVRVLDVIKEGNNDVAPEGKERIFLGFPHCRAALDLKKDQNYLIMGASKDIHVDRRDKLYQYVLGERTWVEYWPTESECETEQHRPTCQGMEELVREYTQYGCRQ